MFLGSCGQAVSRAKVSVGLTGAGSAPNSLLEFLSGLTSCLAAGQRPLPMWVSLNCLGVLMTWKFLP